MWFLANLALTGGMIFFLLQGPTAPSKQNPSAGGNAVSQSQKAPEMASTVAPTQPVITVHGLCGQDAPATDARSCNTVITREQFETLIHALNPDGQAMPANARHSLAQTYAEMVAVEAAARKDGLEDTPEFHQFMTFVRLRTVTELYRRNLQEKYRNPSQEEIDAYYKQHQADFERADLVRILVPRENVPRENPSAADKSAFDKKALEAAQAARERAVKGDDPAQIQKDTYAALSLGEAPSVGLGKRRRADMVVAEATEVFSLKQGEVTQVQTEPNNYVIYKVLSKDALSPENVKAEIVRNIFQQKFKDAMKSALDAAPADLNEQYLQQAAKPQPASGPPHPPSH